MDLGSSQVAPGNEAHHDGMQYGVKLPGTGSADRQVTRLCVSVQSVGHDRMEMGTTSPAAAGGMPIMGPKV